MDPLEWTVDGKGGFLLEDCGLPGCRLPVVPTVGSMSELDPTGVSAGSVRGRLEPECVVGPGLFVPIGTF